MKAIIRSRYGPPDVLRLEDIDTPIPADDRVLVRVHAASVNPYDWHMLTGKPYLVRLQAGLRRPKVQGLGADVAGTVVSVGAGVADLKPGDRVFGGAAGAFAEYVAARPDRLAHMPPNASYAVAAALPIAGLTALQALRDRGRIRPGHAVLVNGASGGVGTFAVQVAKTFGAEVTAVCSTRNVDLVRSLGADSVIDYTVRDFTDTHARFDIIVDMVANRPPSRCRRILAREGVYVGVGAEKKGNWVGPLLGMARVAVAGRVGRRSMQTMLARTTRADLATLAALVEEGKVTPHIDRTYPLDETAAALARQGNGHARGKTVITA